MKFLLLVVLLPPLLIGLSAFGLAVYLVLTRRPLVWGRSSVWILGEWGLLYNLTTALDRLGLAHEVTETSITVPSLPAWIEMREEVAGMTGFKIEPEDPELGAKIVAELRTIYRADDTRLGVLEAAGVGGCSSSSWSASGSSRSPH